MKRYRAIDTCSTYKRVAPAACVLVAFTVALQIVTGGI